MDFDTEKFITEVEKRPAIWNTKCEEYFDKCIKDKEWEELVDIYGGDFSKEEKKHLTRQLRSKWRNVRDSFVKTYKAKKLKSGSKRHVQYMFYKNLLFLEDTVNLNTQHNSRRSERKSNETSESDSEQSSRSWKPKKSKRSRNTDHIGTDLIGAINKNIEQKLEMDDDRLFCLSLVKEFKKIPDHLQIQAKLDLLKVIHDAQIMKFSNSP